MQITSKILSIPPYLSTTWKNIASLHSKAEGQLFTLTVVLKNQTQIEVPALRRETIDEILSAHSRFTHETALPFPMDSPFSFSLPIGLAEPLGFQHNPAQANLPPLQPEILKKIVALIQGLSEEAFPAEPQENCQCMYCQLSRAHLGEKELEISEEDLRFRDWEIKQIGDQLYSVTNPLDANEHYNVFLGTPIGCTCGSKDCEHIQAVLKS